jgi:hypothetical protein
MAHDREEQWVEVEGHSTKKMFVFFRILLFDKKKVSL